MDGLSPITADIGCKPVQEMVKDGDEMPDEYVCKDFHYGTIDDDVAIIDILVVDLKAINSGIDESLVDEVHKVSRQSFDLSMEEKQKYGRAPDDTEGYSNDMVLSENVLRENQILDWTDRLYLLVHPEDKRKLKYWSENPKSFRVILEEYNSRLKLIAEELLRSIAKSMNLPDDRFLKQYGDTPVMYARFSFYPPCPRPKPVHGIIPHADGSAITILLQDKEIMSNGLLKSPVHRVVTNSEKERITVAMFCSPEFGSEIVMTRTGALAVTSIPNHKGLKHPYMSDNHAHNS
ncbi:hypothetical protein CQW23_25230 [Capsicum baccatum]|uniref:Uncharacterized protein n=1 Tax=Capsicum baccatum TaxID=33114 RepID=A0A2G2VKD7_CAPBA|nr:hypothetical protein CQW23_25230 [Capsicum baccatum]